MAKEERRYKERMLEKEGKKVAVTKIRKGMKRKIREKKKSKSEKR